MLVKGLLQGMSKIIHLNKKRGVSEDYESVLKRIHFDEQSSRFVANLRQKVGHGGTCSVRESHALASVILNWGFVNFWRPLLVNNLPKFSPQRLGLLQPYFFQGVRAHDSPMLKGFVRFSRRDSKWSDFFFIDVNYFNSGQFRSNINQILNLQGIGSQNPKKVERSGDLFQIREIDEDQSDLENAEVFAKSVEAPKQQLFKERTVQWTSSQINPTGVSQPPKKEGNKSSVEQSRRKRSLFLAKGVLKDFLQNPTQVFLEKVIVFFVDTVTRADFRQMFNDSELRRLVSTLIINSRLKPIFQSNLHYYLSSFVRFIYEIFSILLFV